MTKYHVCFGTSLACSGAVSCQTCTDMRVQHVLPLVASVVLRVVEQRLGPAAVQQVGAEIAHAIYGTYPEALQELVGQMKTDPALMTRLRPLDLSFAEESPCREIIQRHVSPPYVVPANPPQAQSFFPAVDKRQNLGYVPPPSPPMQQQFTPHVAPAAPPFAFQAPLSAPVKTAAELAKEAHLKKASEEFDAEAARVAAVRAKAEAAVTEPPPEEQTFVAPVPPPAPSSRPVVVQRTDERRQIPAAATAMDAEDIAAAGSPVGQVLGSVMLPRGQVDIVEIAGHEGDLDELDLEDRDLNGVSRDL